MIVVGAIITALIGAVLSYALLLKQSELTRLEAQISNLYGPLEAKIDANTAYWREFCNENCPNEGYFFGQTAMAENDVKIWRRYIRGNGLPDVTAMVALITQNGSLIVGNNMPEQFRKLAIHQGQYQTLAAGWALEGQEICKSEQRNCAELYGAANIARMQWPSSLARCVHEDLKALKEAREKVKSSIFLFRKPEIISSRYCGE